MSEYTYSWGMQPKPRDYVEVVRCRDCEFWEKQTTSEDGTRCLCEVWSYFDDLPKYTPQTGYCHNAERRET